MRAKEGEGEGQESFRVQDRFITSVGAGNYTESLHSYILSGTRFSYITVKLQMEHEKRPKYSAGHICW